MATVIERLREIARTRSKPAIIIADEAVLVYKYLDTLIRLSEYSEELSDSSACAGYPYDNIDTLFAELEKEAT